MADTNSIFYKIGQATKSNVANAISGLLADDNTWTGTNDFNKAVTVGTDGVAADLTVKGVVSGASLSTTGDATVGGNATITGDLVVNGTTTTISTTNLEVKDNIVHLSKGASVGAYNKDSGLYFERGTGLAAGAIAFNESNDRFELGTVGYVQETVTHKAGQIELNGVTFNITLKAGGAFIGCTSVGTASDSSTEDWQKLGSACRFIVGNSNVLASELEKDNADIKVQIVQGNENTIITGAQAEVPAAVDSSLVDETQTQNSATPKSDGTADLANIEPGELAVGALEVAGDNLGNLADFNAGLIA